MYMYQLDFCAVRACVHMEGYLRTTHVNNWSGMSALILLHHAPQISAAFEGLSNIQGR